MIDRVSPVTRPSNREPRERRRALRHHHRPPSLAEVEGHPARQSSKEPHRDATPSHTDAGRQTKIAQLKRAVESGTYHVSAEQVAEKVIAAALVDILA
jgi:anti-sigma28 factor (negative regulator of flagellin synthesis)